MHTKAVIKELYVNLISCAWIAACVALYFLVTAIFIIVHGGIFLEVSLFQRCFIVFRCTTNLKRNALGASRIESSHTLAKSLAQQLVAAAIQAETY